MARGSGEREEFPAIFRKLNAQGTAAAGTKRQVNGGHADDVAPAVGGIGPPPAVLASGRRYWPAVGGVPNAGRLERVRLPAGSR